MNKQKNILKQTKGITLIALIITIVVLLILAGVSINAITGNESAMEKAKEARAKSEAADELDSIKLAVVEAIVKGYTGYIDDEETLTNSLGDLVTSVTLNADESYTVVGSQTGKEYTINKNGQVSDDSNVPVVETVDHIVLSSNSVTVEEGSASSPIIATAYTEDNQVINGVTVVYVSNNPSIATVDTNGVVTGVGNGSTTISVTIGDVTVNCAVTVNKKIIDFTIKVTYYNEEINLQAEEGMTWDEWIESSYYTTLRSAGYTLQCFTGYYAGTYRLYLEGVRGWELVVDSSTIEGNHVYEFEGKGEPI